MKIDGELQVGSVRHAAPADLIDAGGWGDQVLVLVGSSDEPELVLLGADGSGRSLTGPPAGAWRSIQVVNGLAVMGGATEERRTVTIEAADRPTPPLFNTATGESVDTGPLEPPADLVDGQVIELKETYPSLWASADLETWSPVPTVGLDAHGRGGAVVAVSPSGTALLELLGDPSGADSGVVVGARFGPRHQGGLRLDGGSGPAWLGLRHGGVDRVGLLGGGLVFGYAADQFHLGFADGRSAPTGDRRFVGLIDTPSGEARPVLRDGDGRHHVHLPIEPEAIVLDERPSSAVQPADRFEPVDVDPGAIYLELDNGIRLVGHEPAG